MVEYVDFSGNRHNSFDENIEKLKKLFPDVVTDEQGIDIERLSEILGVNDTDQEEDSARYGLSWNGKTNSIRVAQSPTNATLLPEFEKSKDWTDTRNVYIEGDNLETLKVIQKAYSEKVDLIYLDPPYNTGHDFVYEDNFYDSINGYLKQSGIVNDDGQKLSTNTNENGRFHTNWLNMMYPRLRLARNMLSDTGVIFVSIDDNEVANLRLIMDEIFGESNFIAQIAHKSRASVSNDKIISENHNYILLFAKDFSRVFENKKSIGLEPNLEGFSNPDNDPRGEWKTAPVDGPGGAAKGNPYYEFLGVTGYFRYSKDTMQKLYDDGEIVKTKNGLQRKYYKSKAEQSRRTITTWWDDAGLMSNATRELIALMDGKKTFDTPKPVSLVERMLEMFTWDKPNALVMDFFSGSGTTGEAVMRMNQKYGGRRSFLLIQLDELVSDKSEAKKNGYETIPEIALERLTRVANQISTQLTEEPIDTGFKVFKLADSNIVRWQAGFMEDDEKLLSFEGDNIVSDRSSDDVLYEVLIKKGLELTSLVEKHDVDGGTLYDVEMGAVFVITGHGIKRDVGSLISELRRSYEEQDMLVTSNVVFIDEAFENSEEKLNTVAMLRDSGYDASDIESI
ncbi:site-specific DNA-methyltransferase [Leuconostoc mesenteroides]|uniref:site-specific DNA-methyltransferase n=1 Tax=Leuconostoc mesenteroides TaxID=1245 RepID=UPI00235E7CC9|nr:site-specific DNA-methyltransferase [Leuconostoc mesenteroides]